jgi:hypothetical protein
MNTWWAVPMLIGAGLFAGGVISIAWERIPAWRGSDAEEFRTGFAYTLQRVDRLQPALLTVTLASTVGFAISASDTARTLAMLAAAGFLVILVGSLSWLVPIQRRLKGSAPGQPSMLVEHLKTQWLRGHLIRSAMALGLFVLAVTAALV